MKTILALIASLGTAFAAAPFGLQPAPLPIKHWEYVRQLQDQDVKVVEKTLRLLIDADDISLASGSTHTLTASKSNEKPAALPAGAIITSGVILGKEAVVSANGNTLSIGCESTNDIFGATNLAGYASEALHAIKPLNASASMIYVGSGCNITATIGAGASGITKGRLWVLLRYLVAE